MKLDDAKSEKPLIEKLVNLVSMDVVSKEDLAKVYDAGIKVHHFDDVLRAGEANEKFEQEKCSGDHKFMFSYTSGTTGDPKGVKTS